MSSPPTHFVVCPRCRARNPEGGMFCERCDAHLGAAPREGPTPTARCPNCDIVKPPGSGSCPGCGQSIEPSPVCPICRTNVPPRVTACPSCRASFSEVFYGLAFCWRCGGKIRVAPLYASPGRHLLAVCIVAVALVVAPMMSPGAYFLLVLAPLGFWGVLRWLSSLNRPPLLSCRSCGILQRRPSGAAPGRASDPGPVLALLYLLGVILIYSLALH